MENNTKMLLAAITDEEAELVGMLLQLREKQINAIPFKDSWTAAQLATHITKSNKAIAQALEMEGVPAARDPAEKVQGLKDTFLNFNHKMKSPAFIVPEEGEYKKEKIMTALTKSNEALKENAGKADLAEMINLPAAFGEITKLELLHFVWYHTKRHNHQLKNILQHI